MPWNRADYWLEGADVSMGKLASEIFRRVLRQGFDQPGFAIVAFPHQLSSSDLRKAMLLQKAALSELFQERWGQELRYQSMGRFDQQVTTKLHLDGAPERSMLMLGYEPTSVTSELHIADYSACAHDMGLTPSEFLDRHNPMFAEGRELLEPYVTRVTDWREDQPRLVFINNSHMAPGSPAYTAGVMHGAQILSPNPNSTRIINSVMVVPGKVEPGEQDEAANTFWNTDKISGPIMQG